MKKYFMMVLVLGTLVASPAFASGSDLMSQETCLSTGEQSQECMSGGAALCGAPSAKRHESAVGDSDSNRKAAQLAASSAQ